MCSPESEGFLQAIYINIVVMMAIFYVYQDLLSERKLTHIIITNLTRWSLTLLGMKYIIWYITSGIPEFIHLDVLDSVTIA